MSGKPTRRGFFARLLGISATAAVAPEMVKAVAEILPVNAPVAEIPWSIVSSGFVVSESVPLNWLVMDCGGTETNSYPNYTLTVEGYER